MEKFKKHISSGPGLTLLIIITAGLLLTLSSLFLFLKLRSEVLEKEFANFDLQILHLFYNYRSPELTASMTFITHLGDNYMAVICIGLIVLLCAKKHYRESTLLVFVLGMSGIINRLIKYLIQRPRPDFFPLLTLKDYSFPSGHAMHSLVFYITLAYLVFHFTKNKKLSLLVLGLAIIVVLLIGISRIYLGVHYPTDVLGGYLGGICWFTSVLLVQKTLIFFRLFNESGKKTK